MAGKLDTQGWIDRADVKGRPYAFFVRDGTIWVRVGARYKCTQVGASNTIPMAATLAATIARDRDHWMNETRARKLGLPTE
jgi:hypothetical protein